MLQTLLLLLFLLVLSSIAAKSDNDLIFTFHHLTRLPNSEHVAAPVVQVDAGDDDEDALGPARPHAPVALGPGRVLAGEVGRLQNAQAVLRVERTALAWRNLTIYIA